MLYLLTDPAERYIPKGEYVPFYPKDIPSKVSKGNRLRVMLNSKSIVTDKRSIMIYRVDQLKAKQVVTLVTMLYDKHVDVRVTLTCVNDKSVSDHIQKMPSLIRRKIRAPGFKHEKKFYDKLTDYIQGRSVPENDLMLPFTRSIAVNPKLFAHNQQLLCRLDTMLFETNSEYLAVAWAGLHQPQRIRPLFKSVKRDEVTPPKIDPVIKKTRRAKQKQTVKKRRKVGIRNKF